MTVNLYNLYETGFFSTGRKQGVPPDRLNSLLDDAFYFSCNGVIYPGGVFLHGLCDIFAIALHDIFRYPVFTVWDKDKSLIHAFCKIQENNRVLYADARGITSSYEDLIQSFRNFMQDKTCIYQPRPCLGIKHYKKTEYAIFYKNSLTYSPYLKAMSLS